MKELLALPGVGRKIANLILGDVYGKPAIVTDTHCIRLSGRLGFTSENERRPQQIERTLANIIDPSEQSDFCHRLVLFGREVCKARKPSCENCFLRDLCVYNKINCESY
jgi:endonuclease-3